MKININNISISIEKNQDKEIKKEVLKRGIKEDNICRIDYLKRSIDSRKKTEIKFVYNLEVTLHNDIVIDNKDVIIPKTLTEPKRVPKKDLGRIAIIGTGPAGLFAALKLCEYGYSPVIFERGEMVDERDLTIEK
ncbi:MAG: hypothetical protein RSC71_06170 [Cetobacterium sp.]